jgi:hypothetical protein
LHDLKQETIAFQVKWNDLVDRKIYMDKFKQDLTDAIKRQIDYHLTGLIKSNSILYDEILEHAIQCKMLSERYCPRENVLKKVNDVTYY